MSERELEKENSRPRHWARDWRAKEKHVAKSVSLTRDQVDGDPRERVLFFCFDQRLCKLHDHVMTGNGKRKKENTQRKGARDTQGQKNLPRLKNSFYMYILAEARPERERDF